MQDLLKIKKSKQDVYIYMYTYQICLEDDAMKPCNMLAATLNVLSDRLHIVKPQIYVFISEIGQIVLQLASYHDEVQSLFSTSFSLIWSSTLQRGVVLSSCFKPIGNEFQILMI